MKIFFLLLIVHCSLFNVHCFSQGTAINTTGAPADNSAILDVSANGKGILIPRMTTANRPANPVESLIIYNTTTQCFEAYNAATSQWVNIACIGGCTVPDVPAAGINVPSISQIVWNWNTVTGATGYKWNIANNYATATDNGASTSYTQTGLNCGTSYTLYIWAYNSCGSSGVTALTQTSASCSAYICGNDGTFIDARDGQTYGYVNIGTQTWMCQNLNATKYLNGDAIPDVTDGSAWSSLATGAYCDYNNLATNSLTYGRLYNWFAVNDSRLLCPTGWHLPSDAELTTLTTFLGGESVAGGKMKETTTSHWASPNTGATNSSRFTCLPGGGRYDGGGAFSLLGNVAYLWSSTESSLTGAWVRSIHWNDVLVTRNAWGKMNGFSVRCIKD